MNPIVTTLNQPYPLPYIEGIRLELLRAGNHNLFVTMPGLNKKEISDYRQGGIRVGVHEGENLALVFFKFGSQPWIDAPFNACLIPEYEYMQNTFIDTQNEHQRFCIQLTLIDSLTGLVKGLRYFTLSPAISRKLQALAQKQRNKGYSPYDFNQELNSLYTRTTEQLARNVETSLAGMP